MPPQPPRPPGSYSTACTWMSESTPGQSYGMVRQQEKFKFCPLTEEIGNNRKAVESVQGISCLITLTIGNPQGYMGRILGRLAEHSQGPRNSTHHSCASQTPSWHPTSTATLDARGWRRKPLKHTNIHNYAPHTQSS